MARRAHLKPARAAALRLLLILAAVLLVHAAALQWLAGQQTRMTSLRLLPAPMLARLVTQQAPPARPAQEEKMPAARMQKAQPAINSVAVAAPEPAPVEAPVPVQEAPAEPPSAAQAGPTPAESINTVAPPAGPSLEGWPADTRLNYRLAGRFRSGELYGGAHVLWQRDGSSYQIRVEIDVTLLAKLVLTSQGEATRRGLMPQAYEEIRSGKPRSFKLDETSITLADGRSVPRPEGVQDSASQFVELAHRFSTGKEVLEVGRPVSFWMARPGAVDLWTYDVVALETLKTPSLGDVEAFHLTPRPITNPRGNITAEMWFAPSLQYLPVRIRVSMGDEAQVDLLVDSIEQR